MLTDEARAALRARHGHGYTANPRRDYCVRDNQDWPCDTIRVLDALDAAAYFAETWAELLTLMPDEYGCTMNCAEANAAADLFRALGMEPDAHAIADAHAVHDTEEDDHWERGRELRGRQDA